MTDTNLKLKLSDNSVLLKDPSTNENNRAAIGTKKCPFKLAIIGAGPAGCSVIARAVRVNVIDDLCGFTDESGKYCAGVCMIDKDCQNRFGGGRLQDYMINSNTEGRKFVTNITKDKADTIPQEITTNTCLENLKQKDSARFLLADRFERRVVPLETVGAFLRDVGATIQRLLKDKYSSSSRCMVNTSALSIQRVRPPSPPVTSDSSNSQTISEVDDFDGWELSLKSSDTEGVQKVYAQTVLLSTGGRQDPLPSLGNTDADKIVSSDSLISLNGFREVSIRLYKHLHTSGPSNSLKVVIIGGSHSGFSAAWMMLHRLQHQLDLCSLDTSTPICRTNSKGSPSKKPSRSSKESGAVTISVCIIHRSPIKVYYDSKVDAERDGYVLMPGDEDTPGGRVNGFCGLRGDAKDLWKAVRDGRESRLRFLLVKPSAVVLAPSEDKPVDDATKDIPTCDTKANNRSTSEPPMMLKMSAMVEKLVDESALVVWACGYKSNTIPVFQSDGLLLTYRYAGGQVMVDRKANILFEQVEGPTNDAEEQQPTVPMNIRSPRCNRLVSSTVPVELPSPLLSPVPPSPMPSSPSTMAVVTTTTTTTTTTEGSGSVAGTGKESDVKSFCSPTRPSIAQPILTSPITSPSKASPAKAAKFVKKGPGSLLGMGLGFGLMEKNGERADGVGIYIKKAANLVLSQVVGEKVFGSGGQNSWEERYRQKQVMKRQQKGKGTVSHESPTISLQSPESAQRTLTTNSRPQTVHAAFRYSNSDGGSHGNSNQSNNSNNGHVPGRLSLGGSKGKTTPSKPAPISTPVVVEQTERPVVELAMNSCSLQTVTEGLAELELPVVVVTAAAAPASPIKIVSMVLPTPVESKSALPKVLPKLSPRSAVLKSVQNVRPLTAQPLSKAVVVVHTAGNRPSIGGKLQPPSVVTSPTSSNGKQSQSVGVATHTVRLLKTMRQDKDTKDKDKPKAIPTSAQNQSPLLSKSLNGPINSITQRATSSSGSQGSKKPGRMSLPSAKALPIVELKTEKVTEASLLQQQQQQQQQQSLAQAAVVVSDLFITEQQGVLVGQVDRLDSIAIYY